MKKRTLLISILAFLIVTQQPEYAHAYSEEQIQQVTTDQERQVILIRNQEIQQLRLVLGRRYTESRRPDLLLRLAELYIERYRFFFFKENEIHQRALQQGTRSSKVNHNRSRQELKIANEICLAILKSRVPFERLDQVYYFLGYNAQEMNDLKAANQYFKTVITRFPSSPSTPEAYRNLAENAFQSQKYTEAVAYYEKAARYTELPSYPRTLYKLAWAYFRTRKKSQALNSMKRVIATASQNEKFGGVREEALNDIVMMFAEAGEFEEARSFFSKIEGGAEFYVTALKKLAVSYKRQGKYKLAEQVKSGLVQEYGDKRPDLIFEMLAENLENARLQKNEKQESHALEKILRFHAEHRETIERSEKAKEIVERVQVYVRGKASEIHKKAQKSSTQQKKKLYVDAARFYALFLQHFSHLKKPEEISQIRIYRADCLLASDQENQAIGELEKTLREEGNQKYRYEAGTTLLNLLIKKLDAARGQKQHASPAMEKKFIELANLFESVFPKDPLIPELRFKKTKLGYAEEDNHRILKKYIDDYPQRKESLEAAQELVSEALKRKQTQEATELAKEFLANDKLMQTDSKGELKQYLTAIVQRQSFANIQDLEKDQNYLEAARRFESLSKNAGGDREVEQKAQYNAAINYEKAGDGASAVRLLLTLLKQKNSPYSKNANEDLKRMASQFLWKGSYEEAIRVYESLHQQGIEGSNASQSYLRTAFYIAVGIEKPEEAQRLLQKISNVDLSFEYGALLVKKNELEKALLQYRNLASRSTDRKAEALFWVADLYHRLHEPKKARSYLEQTADLAQKNKKGISPKDRNFIARASFQLIQPTYDKFNEINLQLPEKVLQERTKQKLGMLESLVSRYVNVVNIGDGEWGIAAFERIASLFMNFADALEQVPIPEEYQGDRRTAYRKGIEQVTSPMRAKALDYLKQGRQTGFKLWVTSPTFIALSRKLGENAFKQYPLAHYTMQSEGLKLTGEVESDTASWRKNLAQRLSQNPKQADLWVALGNLEARAGRYRLAKLFYEQALSLNSKNPQALCNLSILHLMERHPLEATQGFLKAIQIAEFSKEIRFNFAKTLLAYHHFDAALDHLKPLAGRYPEELEIQKALFAALVGDNQLGAAMELGDRLNAKNSEDYNLAYNWSVAQLIKGSEREQDQAVSTLEDLNPGNANYEKDFIDTALKIFQKQKGDKHS